MELGYSLSSEEQAPDKLVATARRAEEVGFQFLMVSDHFHPWVNQQGQSPFVWSVLGGIAQATERITVGTGVTCPIMRFHPALVAQAASTMAAMMIPTTALGAPAAGTRMGFSPIATTTARRTKPSSLAFARCRRDASYSPRTDR